ncbi:hypothetical protein [Epilithonimonas caeni]|uniref:hypothetical protein n=1 Tax=Epilithonimonas caeni TaxID=365343 RepID=UPI0012EC0F8A|nr:hypothetical protein [Epilithonimonas caeni]
MEQNNFNKKLLPNDGSEFIGVKVFVGGLILLLYYLDCYYYYQYCNYYYEYGYECYCDCYWSYECYYYYYGCY